MKSERGWSGRLEGEVLEAVSVQLVSSKAESLWLESSREAMRAL